MTGQEIRCPICKGKVFEYPNNRQMVLKRCDLCGLIFRYPQPKHKDILQLYQDDSYFSFWGETKDFTAVHKMKLKTAEILFDLLNKLGFVNPGQLLLDVGCASGAFLEEANKFGLIPYGLELNKIYYNFAKKNNRAIVKNESLENTSFPKNYFDIIILFDVLEHFSDIKQAVKTIYGLLKTGGVIVISTPNTDSLSFKLLGRAWPHFKKEHLFYFNPCSISTFLTKNGFKILHIGSSKKALSLRYIKSHFTTFHVPVMSFLIKILIPNNFQKILSVPLQINNGNMLIIAKKT